MDKYKVVFDKETAQREITEEFYRTCNKIPRLYGVVPGIVCTFSVFVGAFMIMFLLGLIVEIVCSDDIWGIYGRVSIVTSILADIAFVWFWFVYENKQLMNLKATWKNAENFDYCCAVFEDFWEKDWRYTDVFDEFRKKVEMYHGMLKVRDKEILRIEHSQKEVTVTYVGKNRNVYKKSFPIQSMFYNVETKQTLLVWEDGAVHCVKEYHKFS